MIERVADRLRFETDRTVTVLSGKVELGQGLNDALTLICSEELALEPDRIRVRYGDTEATPDDGLTAGSGSMERAGAAVRDAARSARNELLRRASERLEVPVHRLEACSGAIRPRAAGAAGEPAPTPTPAADRQEAATVEQHPPRDTGGSTPAAGAPTAGAGIDYWDLLESEECGAAQTAWRHPAEAVGMAAAADGRDNPSQATKGSASPAAAAGARPAGRSSAHTARVQGTPPAQRPPTTAPQPEARATGRSSVHQDVSDARPSANRDTAPDSLPNRSLAADHNAPDSPSNQSLAGASAPPGTRPDSRGAADPPSNRSLAAGEEETPPANRHVASAVLPNRSHAAGRQGAWRRVDRVVRGAGNFVHDLRLPGMVHGRVLRPPGYGQRLTALAADAARAMRGVLAVVVDGSFVAVAAEREEQASAAHDVLAASARWQPQPNGDPAPDGRAAASNAPRGAQRGAQRTAQSGATPPRHRSTPPGVPADGRAALREAPAETTPVLHRGAAPPDVHTTTITAAYSRPFLMHGALGPSAAAARLERDGRLTIWSHTQGPFELRAALAEALQRAPESIRVIHADGSGCYGHNGADDVALDAALLALAVPERPVLVKWTRADENRWEPFGTAMIVTCSAELDTTGAVLSWRHEARSHAHGTRPRATPGHSTLLAAWHRAAPLNPPAPRNGSGLTAGPQRNAEPLYHFPEVAIATHFVPAAPVRVSALRSLGAFANVFAIESFMDELAARCGDDPLAYRLRHLRDERAKRVLTEAVRAAPAAGIAAPQAADSGAATVRADAAADAPAHANVHAAVPTRSPAAAVADNTEAPATAPAEASAEAPAVVAAEGAPANALAEAPAEASAAAWSEAGQQATPVDRLSSSSMSAQEAPSKATAAAASGSPAEVAAVMSEATGAPPAATGAAAASDSGDTLLGRGIAVARYKNLQACVAVVCDVAVDPGSGQIRLLHATIAADAGRIIDRDGLANQLEGGFLQAASWTLKEQVRWDRAAIRSTDWDTYPVLRFSEVPPVTVRLIDRPDLPSVGAGEAAQGPTPAAIANAVYAAAGIRLRHTPFTPARVMAALSGA